MNQIQHPNPSVQMNVILLTSDDYKNYKLLVFFSMLVLMLRQVGQLIHQIDHEYPKIEPFQMFEINPGLFPTVTSFINTVIIYLQCSTQCVHFTADWIGRFVHCGPTLVSHLAVA